MTDRHPPASSDTDPSAEDPDEHEEYDDEEPGRRVRPRWFKVALGVAVLAVVGLGVGLGLGLSGSSTPSGPEGVPVQNVPDLASANSTVTGATVDGITCRKSMAQFVGYHVHAHVDIFVNGVQERIPAGAGIVAPRTESQIPGGLFVDNGLSSCLYWLHVHANDGIIHIEAPNHRTFTLGQFFDVWGQPLGPDQVGPALGPVVAFENGKEWTGNPRDIPLLSQAVIQLDVGTPVVPFKPMTFKVTGLCSTSCTSPASG